MTETDKAAMDRLREIDIAIGSTAYGRCTLCPTADNATPLSEIVVRYDGIAHRDQLAQMLAKVAGAQLLHFPENIFWDFDYFAASIQRAAADSSDPVSYYGQAASIAAELMALYGAQGTIQFQYVHDFMYGFDWARWVARDSAARSNLGPFSLEFMKDSKTRGYELVAMIAKNDDRYPTLPRDARRNPFPFSRTPEHEKLLYEDLAAHQLIPVQNWAPNAVPDWQKDYDTLREQRANEAAVPPTAQRVSL